MKRAGGAPENVTTPTLEETFHYFRTWERSVPHGYRNAFQEELLVWWELLETDTPADFEAVPARWRKNLNAVVENNRRLYRTRRAQSVAQHIFDALPEPVVLFTERGVAWNPAFAAALALEQRQQRGLPLGVRTSPLMILQRLARNVRQYLRNNVLYYPIGGTLFSVVISEYPERDLRIAYLNAVPCHLQDIPSDARQVLVLRISGLSLKQIEILLGMKPHRAGYLSRRHRGKLQELRQRLVDSRSR